MGPSSHFAPGASIPIELPEGHAMPAEGELAGGAYGFLIVVGIVVVVILLAIISAETTHHHIAHDCEECWHHAHDHK